MHRDENTCKEQLVLLFQGQSKTINDRAQDFKQLSNSIESFCFVNELEKDVIDGTPNERPKIEKFSIDTM